MPTGIYKRKRKFALALRKKYQSGEFVIWNKGKKFPAVTGNKQHFWKGSKASYFAIHIYIKNHFGKANKCDNPNCVYPRRNSKGVLLAKPSRYEWASLTKKPTRKKEDYKQLCPSCHRRMDMKIIKI